MFTHHKISVDEYLAEHILDERRLNPQDRAGRGWQSRAYRDQPFAWVESTYRAVESAVGTIDSWWFNANTPGEYTGWHAHHRWPRVAVLYVSVPAGDIEFRQGGAYWSETPKQGDLLVFAGDLEHRVTPNTSDAVRISVAFNFNKR